MSARSCTGCINTLLSEYPRCFERALAKETSDGRIVFHACYSYEDGDDDETHDTFSDDHCLRVVVEVKSGEVHITMRSPYNDIYVECVLSFHEAEAQIALYGSNRTRLAFRRLVGRRDLDVAST